MIEQDFALLRIILYLENYGFKITILQLNKSKFHNKFKKVNIIEFENENDILKYLKQYSFDIVFHRSWMHRYLFASKILKIVPNAVLYIKDWYYEYTKKEYKFCYDTDEDYDAIKYIIKQGKLILSHYSHHYTDLVAKSYDVSKDKFIFFPEFTHKPFYNKRKRYEYNSRKINIVYAGSLLPTSLPEQLIAGKATYNSIKKIANQNINITALLLPKYYKNVFNNEKLYSDYLYENKFNKYFYIKKGAELKYKLLNQYDFGFFALHDLPSGTKYKSTEIHGVTSKFAFYMEAGLPVIVAKNMTKLANIVKKYKIGLVVTDKEFFNLNKVLDISAKEYDQLVENIYKFRNVFSYNEDTLKVIFKLL